MKDIQQKINYHFKNPHLLKLALTHSSASKNNNNRLEFLGDSVLGAVISFKLYELFNNIDEGKLTRLRSHLVRGQTLTKLAFELELPKNIILGQGEIKSAGFTRDSLQADVLEAIFGAIFLDSNFDTTSKVILNIYQKLLANIDTKNSLKDAKTKLQEYLQKQGRALPQYKVIDVVGKEHNATFTVNCTLVDQKIQTQQKAKNIKIAEQLCAETILEKIKTT